MVKQEVADELAELLLKAARECEADRALSADRKVEAIAAALRAAQGD